MVAGQRPGVRAQPANFPLGEEAAWTHAITPGRLSRRYSRTTLAQKTSAGGRALPGPPVGRTRPNQAGDWATTDRVFDRLHRHRADDGRKPDLPGRRSPGRPGPGPIGPIRSRTGAATF